MTETKTILIVDDDPDFCVYISTFLEDNGFSTIVANDGVQALEKVKDCIPDLVTLDITMPEKSGAGFYREMKESEQLKSIPIIIITGVAHDFQKFISSRRQVPPPEGYLTKPIETSDLLEEINKLVP